MSYQESSLWMRNPDLMTAAIDDEIVMLSLKHNRYFALDEIGRRIWELLATPSSAESLCAVLHQEFDVETAQCLKDVHEFLSEMESLGLIHAATDQVE